MEAIPGLIPTWKLMRNCLMAVPYRLLSTNVTAIETSQTKSKLAKPNGKLPNSTKTIFLMAVISGWIPTWKLMRNCPETNRLGILPLSAIAS